MHFYDAQITLVHRTQADDEHFNPFVIIISAYLLPHYLIAHRKLYGPSPLIVTKWNGNSSHYIKQNKNIISFCTSSQNIRITFMPVQGGICQHLTLLGSFILFGLRYVCRVVVVVGSICKFVTTAQRWFILFAVLIQLCVLWVRNRLCLCEMLLHTLAKQLKFINCYSSEVKNFPFFFKLNHSVFNPNAVRLCSVIIFTQKNNPIMIDRHIWMFIFGIVYWFYPKRCQHHHM